MGTIAENKSSLNNLQLELLKSLKYMASEKQLQEVKSLLRYYFAQQLDAAIDKAEAEKNYSAEIYQKWLQANNNSNNSFVEA